MHKFEQMGRAKNINEHNDEHNDETTIAHYS
jgi:hypothetical protein